MSEQHEIIYNDREFIVEGEYEKGTSGIWTLRNGDPGYDDESPEFYINHVINIAGIDVTDKFKAEDFKNMQEIVLTKYEGDDDGK